MNDIMKMSHIRSRHHPIVDAEEQCKQAGHLMVNEKTGRCYRCGQVVSKSIQRREAIQRTPLTPSTVGVYYFPTGL